MGASPPRDARTAIKSGTCLSDRTEEATADSSSSRLCQLLRRCGGAHVVCGALTVSTACSPAADDVLTPSRKAPVCMAKKRVDRAAAGSRRPLLILLCTGAASLSMRANTAEQTQRGCTNRRAASGRIGGPAEYNISPRRENTHLLIEHRDPTGTHSSAVWADTKYR